jgi:hypothetical protein
MTPILAAPSTRTNWPDHEFEVLRTWYPSDACSCVDQAIYYPIFEVCVKFRGL